MNQFTKVLYVCSYSPIPKWAMYGCALLWIGTFPLMFRLPPVEHIRPELLNPPTQYTALRPEQIIEYKGTKNHVRPLAEYSLYGLVVSHNDPSIWYRFDITHDEKSLNTRDVCVVWGKVVKEDGYRHISFGNSDTQCEYWVPPEAGYFSENELSNNHLITASDDIRKKIHTLRVGDQIFIKGALANYYDERWNGRVRRTSGSREDRGEGACEIILVEELQVLESYNKFWHWLHALGFWGLVSLVLFRIFLFFRFE